jgi:hypothetical protein
VLLVQRRQQGQRRGLQLLAGHDAPPASARRPTVRLVPTPPRQLPPLLVPPRLRGRLVAKVVGQVGAAAARPQHPRGVHSGAALHNRPQRPPLRVAPASSEVNRVNDEASRRHPARPAARRRAGPPTAAGHEFTGLRASSDGVAHRPAPIRVMRAYRSIADSCSAATVGASAAPAASLAAAPAASSRHPPRHPSRHPSRQPTRHPTRQPTRHPTRQPTRQPSRQPPRHPTRQPTRQPLCSGPAARPVRRARPRRGRRSGPAPAPSPHPHGTPGTGPARSGSQVRISQSSAM